MTVALLIQELPNLARCACRAFVVSLPVLFVAAALPGDAMAVVAFTAVTDAAGIDHVQFTPLGGETEFQPFMSGGAAAGDFDGDGWVDLYFTRLDAADILYRNLGNGTFDDVTASTFGADHLTNVQTNGAAWADIDNDDDLDLYVTSLGVNRYHLFVNQGNGAFTEEAAVRGAAVAGDDLHYGFSPAFGDYDRDGFLDLHVTEWRLADQNATQAPHNTRLLRNRGPAAPGHFTDVTVQAGVATDGHQPTWIEADSQSFASRFVDFDGDGNVDLAITSDHNTSRLFWNNGDGTFTDGTSTAGVASDQYGMGNTIGDVDGDGDFDWFVTSVLSAGHPTRDGNRLYLNQGDRTFTDATDAAGVRDGGWGWGTAMFDCDNDGDLDVVETNGQSFPFNPSIGNGFEHNPMRLWENDGTGVFAEIAQSTGLTDDGNGKGLITFDYDNDGDLDVLVVNNAAAPVLYRNDTAEGNDWLQIETRGRSSNRQGVGTLVVVDPDEAVAGDEIFRQIEAGNNFLGQNPAVAHFGLGEFAGTIDRVTLRWPSGIVQVLDEVIVNQRLLVTELFAADFDADGDVDIDDFLRWQSHFGAPAGGTHAMGDADVDGDVDGNDFLIWQNQFGSTSSPVGGVAAQSVPEPAAWLLLLVALVALLGQRPA